jgi:hypothetical protein
LRRISDVKVSGEHTTSRRGFQANSKLIPASTNR